MTTNGEWSVPADATDDAAAAGLGAAPAQGRACSAVPPEPEDPLAAGTTLGSATSEALHDPQARVAARPPAPADCGTGGAAPSDAELLTERRAEVRAARAHEVQQLINDLLRISLKNDSLDAILDQSPPRWSRSRGFPRRRAECCSLRTSQGNGS